MAERTRRRSGPGAARVAIWEHLNANAGPFTELARLEAADGERLRVALLEDEGCELEGWLVTPAEEVSALFRVGDSWVLLDGFAGPRGPHVLLTLTSPSDGELAAARDRLWEAAHPGADSLLGGGA
jgi:hypothetical protein